MRNQYRQVLKVFFHYRAFQARAELGITQEEMAHRLSMSSRTYVELEHGKTCCGAVTLALYLVYVCDDPDEFLEELKHAFEAVRAEAK